MNISFDKALLWLIPYLYLISVAYYWGFWKPFNVDAFNYYPVSDLVKGVTYPLGTTLGAMAGLLGFNLVSRYLMLTVLKRAKFVWVVFTFLILLLLMGVCVASMVWIRMNSATLTLSADTNATIFNEQSSFDMILMPLSLVIAYIIDEQLPPPGDATTFRYVVRTTGLLFLLYLPCQIYLDARKQARQIQYRLIFDYTLADSLSTPNKAIYKYLGKAGEYHILLTLDNAKRIIIPADKLAPLIIDRYSVLDSSSVSRFNIYQKQLVAEALQKKSP